MVEQLRKAQREKRSNKEPTQIIDRAIYHLWETINDLEQIQPDNIEFFRVSIFGSSRIRRGDPIYEDVVHLSRELAALGVDIVTGGGPGLMEAANSGAVEGRQKTRSRSFGLPIHLPTEESANPFVDQVFKHRTFFSRLHHFVRLSSAFVVMPGGIGTALELFLIWQLLQVKHIRKHPLILVGNMWSGLIDWMEMTMESRGLVSPGDIQIATVVPTADDALPIIAEIYEDFRKQKQERSNAKRKRK